MNGQTSAIPSLLLMVFFIFLIYFMMIRPQRKKDKADKEMRESLRVGDEVITIGGVVGKVEKITDKTVVISTGAQKNKIEFLKTAIASSGRGGDSSKADKSEDKAESKPVFEEDKTPDRSKKVTPKKLTKKSEEEAAE